MRHIINPFTWYEDIPNDCTELTVKLCAMKGFWNRFKRQNIKSLIIRGNHMTSLKLDLPNLETLIISENKMTIVKLDLPNLKKLIFTDNNAHSVSLNIPSIKEITVRRNIVTTFDFTAARTLSHNSLNRATMFVYRHCLSIDRHFSVDGISFNSKQMRCEVSKTITAALDRHLIPDLSNLVAEYR